MGKEVVNQAHPRGSFLGIAVSEYQHSDDHPELTHPVRDTRELGELLAGCGYHPTVLENPAMGDLRTGLREWRVSTAAPSPVLMTWAGHAMVDCGVLRLAARDTAAVFESGSTYRPESLVENALGTGADQILILIETMGITPEALHEVGIALDDWAKRTFPGEAGWLGILASCESGESGQSDGSGQRGGSVQSGGSGQSDESGQRDERRGNAESAQTTNLLTVTKRLLQEGPSSDHYRRAWTEHNAAVTGHDLLQALREELTRYGKRPLAVESGTARVMFRNPRWQPEPRAYPVDQLVTAVDGAAPQQEEWLFTGRRAVLERIVSWMHAETPGVFVVTGSAGCGKSAVVRRIVSLSNSTERAALLAHAPLAPADPDPGVGAVDLAVHLRSLRAHDLATVLADRLGLPAPANCWQLVAAVATMDYAPILVFDGLDEAVPEQITTIVTDLLVPLSAVASVLIATRYQEFGLRSPAAGETSSDLLRELFGQTALIVDLDTEPGTAGDIERYVADRLRTAGRTDLVARVAPVLASHAAARPGGFLHARIMVAQTVRQVIDVTVEGWAEHLTTTPINALEHDLTSGATLVRDGAQLVDAARDLLGALAWTVGRGMPVRGIWEAAATALSPHGVRYRTADLEWLLEHYGCYIVEDGEHGQAVYRLSHREFVQYFVESSLADDGRPGGPAVAEALIRLAESQTTLDGAPDQPDPYLRHHLAKHVLLAGPQGVTALQRLAAADPEVYLPDLGVSLNHLATNLFVSGNRTAALIAAQQGVDTYRALAGANPQTYLPSLAAALYNLAAQLADKGQHEAALAPVQEAVDIYRGLAEASPEVYLPNLARTLNNHAVYLSVIGERQVALDPGVEATEVYRVLTEAYPEVYFTDLVTSLKNLAGHLAALDRISDAIDVYTTCIDTFAGSPAARDALIIERAGCHINHGDTQTGLRELVTLLTSGRNEASDAIMLAARNALRGHYARDERAVNCAWRAVSGTEPPDWLALTAAEIDVVVEWIMSLSWAESKSFFLTHSEQLLSHPATVALEELYLLVAPRAEQHQELLHLVRELGVEEAYRPLVLRDLLRDWISAKNWQDSRSFAEEHATDLLTGEAEFALFKLEHPTATVVHLALLRIARREGIGAAYACVMDRRFAADRMRQALAEVEPDPIAELAALEGQVFGERFTAAAHLAVAASLMGEVVTDPVKLEELAKQADPADRQRVAAEIAELLGRVPEQAGFLAALPEVLLRLTTT